MNDTGTHNRNLTTLPWKGTSQFEELSMRDKSVPQDSAVTEAPNSSDIPLTEAKGNSFSCMAIHL